MSQDDADFLMTVDIGQNRFPPDPGEGWAEVLFSAEYELDAQKPHGKDDADIKGVGRKAREVTIILHWTNRIDDLARSFIREVSPVGPNQGKAWELVHPDTELYNVDSIQLKSMGEIKRTPGERTLTLKGLSWAKKAPVQKGTGAVTAKKPEEWTDPTGANDHVLLVTSDGNTIDMGPGPVTYENEDGNNYGFNGADAPAPEVP